MLSWVGLRKDPDNAFLPRRPGSGVRLGFVMVLAIRQPHPTSFFPSASPACATGGRAATLVHPILLGRIMTPQPRSLRRQRCSDPKAGTCG